MILFWKLGECWLNLPEEVEIESLDEELRKEYNMLKGGGGSDPFLNVWK